MVGDEIVESRGHIKRIDAHPIAFAGIVFFGLFSALPTPAHATDATGLVKQMAARHGVPQSFALRVAKVESGVKCGRVGAAGERGPLQILPRSARGLGYRNIAKAGCAAQTSAGMKHLAMCWRKARGNQFRAAACHNGGPGVLQWKRIPKSVQAYARKVTR
jgi:soluble lytic murein transglycosylase-like protein